MHGEQIGENEVECLIETWVSHPIGSNMIGSYSYTASAGEWMYSSDDIKASIIQ